MKMKTIALATLLALGTVGAAQAASVGAISQSYGRFQWEDDNGERLVKGAGNTDPGMATKLEVGDFLTGVVEITNIKQLVSPFSNAPLFPPLNNHLAGVFTTQVLSKTLDASGYTFTFGVVGGGTGTIIQFYESPVDNLSILGCPTDAACKGAVTDGTLILELGFNGDPDEFWTSSDTPTDDLGVLKLASGSSGFGAGNFGFSVTGVNTIGTFLETQSTFGLEDNSTGNNKVQWLGTVAILGGADSTAYQATSDADFQAELLPEPGSLALVGLGLVASLGFARRKQQ